MSGSARTYAYNGDGLLQSRTGAGATTFLWDPSTSPSRELKQGSDNIIYGLGPLYVVKADATTVTFARDGSKNVRAEVNASGTATASFRYRAYGQLAQSTNTGPTYLGLASQLLDPSGLYYMRARWYDPLEGRFVTRDPYSGHHDEPASLNAYAYAAANPVMLSDPTGLCGLCDWLGTTVHDTLWGDRSEVHEVDGVNVTTNAGGLIGGFVEALNGNEGAMTFGSDTIVTPTTLEVARIEVLSHEMQHIPQAKDMGLAYIPVYLVELFVVAPIAMGELNLLERKHVSFHDAHPMERQAIIWDTGDDPWR